MLARWGPSEHAPEHRYKAWTGNIAIRGSLKIGDEAHSTGSVAPIEPQISRGPPAGEVKALHAFDDLHLNGLV